MGCQWQIAASCHPVINLMALWAADCIMVCGQCAWIDSRVWLFLFRCGSEVTHRPSLLRWGCNTAAVCLIHLALTSKFEECLLNPDSFLKKTHVSVSVVAQYFMSRTPKHLRIGPQPPI